MKIENVDTDDQALARLRAGQVQAVFTHGGWPSPAISQLRARQASCSPAST